MESIVSNGLGIVFYTGIVFVAGGLIGTPLWNWMKNKMPWSK